MNFKLIVPRGISLGHCPKCDSMSSLDRVRIDSIYDKILLKVFQIRSYHCRICKWSGRLFLYKIKNNPGKILLNYALVIGSFVAFLIIISLFMRK